MSCLCTQYARATEWAALAGARWLGRADEDAAEEAASSSMKAALDEMQIEGDVVIGGRVTEELAPGGSVGPAASPSTWPSTRSRAAGSLLAAARARWR